MGRAVDFVFGYDFFISYAWRDGNIYASRLARELADDGFDVFLDRTHYASGDDWKKVGSWTLARTGSLVLVGTQAALVSAPVLREVAIFSRTSRRIVPIDFGGSLKSLPPDAPLAPYLPEAILRIEEPVAALEQGPTAEAVATLRRSFNIARQDKKRLRVAFGIALVLLLLAVAAMIFAAYAHSQRLRAEATLAAATESADRFVTDIARKLRNAAGLPLSDIGDLLNDAGAMLDALHEHNADNPSLAQSRAVFLRETSQNLLAAGDAAKALDAARQSLDLLLSLKNRPGVDQASLRHDLALSYNRIGDAYRKLDDRKAAFDNFRLALAIRMTADQTPEEQSELAAALERTADEFRETDPAAAVQLYEHDFQIRSRLAETFPDRLDFKEALAIAYERMSIVAGFRGDDRLRPYREALALRETLVEREPQNASFRASLANNYFAIGAILGEGDCSAPARSAFRKALEIRRALVERAWDNADLRGKLAKTQTVLSRCGDDSARNDREAMTNFEKLDQAGKLPADLRPYYDEVVERVGRMPAAKKSSSH